MSRAAGTAPSSKAAVTVIVSVVVSAVKAVTSRLISASLVDSWNMTVYASPLVKVTVLSSLTVVPDTDTMRPLATPIRGT